MEMKTIQPMNPPAFSGGIPAQPRPQVSFGGGQHEIHFGASDREGVKGAGNLFTRFLNRWLRKGHANEDEQLKKDPVPFLRARREELTKKVKTATHALKGTIADRDNFVKYDLTKAQEKYEQEKSEAVFHGKKFKAMDPGDPAYAKQKALVEKESREWKAAEAELNAANKRLEELNKQAKAAELEIKDAERQMEEINATLKDAETDVAVTAGRKAITEAREALGSALASDTQLQDVLGHIRREKRIAEIDSDTDSRLAELEGREEMRTQEALSDLDALLAEEDKK